MRVKNILFSLFLITAMTSCFEIVEQVKVKKDGSGTIKLIANLSQSKERLNKILAQDQINGLIIPSKDTINYHFKMLEKTISSTSGLTLTNFNKDFENYIFSLDVTFESVEKVNILLNKIHSTFNRSNKKQPPLHLAFSNNEFTQTLNKFYIENLNNQISKYNLSELNKAKITTIIQLEKPIKSLSTPEGKISKSGKSALVKLNLKQFLNTYSQQSLNIQTHE